MSTADHAPEQAPDQDPAPHNRQKERIFGRSFDLLELDQTLSLLFARGEREAFGYVVTPNVDHLVRLADRDADPRAKSAYDDAWLCLCDSKIVALLARLRGRSLTVVPGSDLTANFLADPRIAGATVAIIGGEQETLSHLQTLYPDTTFVQHLPPMGLASNPAAISACADFVAAHTPRFVLLAVGSPQQELVAAEIKRRDLCGTGLCIGASIDFLTGKVQRAPRWMRAMALEWLHRLLSEPRRLWRRYLVTGPRILLIALRGD